MPGVLNIALKYKSKIFLGEKRIEVKSSATDVCVEGNQMGTVGKWITNEEKVL